MALTGKQVRNAAIVTFDLTIIFVLPFHAVNALWFWLLVAILTAVSAATVIILEVLRLVFPYWTDNWWGDEG